MKEAQQIKEMLDKLYGNRTPVVSAEVVSVNKSAWTCEAKEANGKVYADVMLKVLRENEKGIVAIPKKGATVLMLWLGGSDYVVIGVEEAEEMLMDIDGTTVEIKKNLLQLNGGNNGGLAIVSELVKKYNALEKDLNTFKSTFQAALAVPVPEPGSGANSAFQTALNSALTSYLGKSLTLTVKQDIENPNVTH